MFARAMSVYYNKKITYKIIIPFSMLGEVLSSSRRHAGDNEHHEGIIAVVSDDGRNKTRVTEGPTGWWDTEQLLAGSPPPVSGSLDSPVTAHQGLKLTQSAGIQYTVPSVCALYHLTL